MLERRTLRAAIAVAAIAALVAAGCGAGDRNEVSTSAGSAVTAAPSETTVESDTTHGSSAVREEERSSTTIPFSESSTPSDPVDPLPYNVLASPREFDETIGSLAPKQPEEPALATLCIAYYELFAGYRLLDQFSDTKESGLARGLAMRRIRSAIVESRRVPGSQIEEEAQSEQGLANSSRALVALQENLGESAQRAETEIERGDRAGDDAAAKAAAGAVLNLPADQRSALDQLGDSDSGCVERRTD